MIKFKQTPYQFFLSVLRTKDRPGPMLPTGVVATNHANHAGNYMGNPKSNWANPENAPPSCWEGLVYDT